MTHQHITALADAVNERKKTTAALSLLVDLLDQAGLTGPGEINATTIAHAHLLELFVDKMHASDALMEQLVLEARASLER
ncbi:hypothetical protein [Propionivibrio limicola]|uniref:hypothetical protein n=1 Tax=Propionivibrio limicola TaxID=167645 RepID=UPI001290ABC8|nr:hypothetical protein [Propionivibrio limicola]